MTSGNASRGTRRSPSSRRSATTSATPTAPNAWRCSPARVARAASWCPTSAQAVLGTPNACYTQSGYACYQPRSMSCSHVLGAYYPEMDYAGGLEGTYDNPAYQVPGRDGHVGQDAAGFQRRRPVGTCGHRPHEARREAAFRVDPRVNWLATRAEVHLRVRPGTDTAMAMAWLSIIINEDLYDHDFVEKWTYGFDEFAARINDPVMGMTPEQCRRDLRGAGGGHLPGRAHVRQRQAGLHRLGPGLRPEPERQPGRPTACWRSWPSRATSTCPAARSWPRSTRLPAWRTTLRCRRLPRPRR